MPPLNNKPDYILFAKERSTDLDSKPKSRIGAAWINSTGKGINITLNVGVSLSWNDNIYITLWPNEPYEDSKVTPDSLSKSSDGTPF